MSSPSLVSMTRWSEPLATLVTCTPGSTDTGVICSLPGSTRPMGPEESLKVPQAQTAPRLVSAAELHHGGAEALLLLAHLPAQAPLVIAPEGPHPALGVQHGGVHAAGGHVHRALDASHHLRPGFLHDVLAEAELAGVPLAHREHVARAPVVPEA